jgi:hypothetical protein
MKTNELEGAALDWAIQQCEGQRKDIDFLWWTEDYSPSTDWAQGGPIIEREQISVDAIYDTAEWVASLEETKGSSGPTPLIAAMRCYVASYMGDEIQLPEDLR